MPVALWGRALIDDSLEQIFRVDEGLEREARTKLGQRLGVVDL
jgi:hypothetical protein